MNAGRTRGGRRADPAEASAEEVLRRAFDLLKRRAHAERELRRKLVQRGFGVAQIDAAIERCRAEGWLQDEDFARDFADELVRSSRYGRRRIVQKLQERGIDRDRAEQAVATAGAEVDWVERARALITRRNAGDEIDADERAKLSRFLLQRGFDPAEINAALAPSRSSRPRS